MSTEFKNDTMICVYICQIRKCWKLVQQFYRESWKCSSFDARGWIETMYQELQAHILVFETEPGLNNFFLFFSSFKRISNISRERKKILYMRLKIEIYSGSEYENWTHIFVDIYDEEWFELKNKPQFKKLVIYKV